MKKRSLLIIVATFLLLSSLFVKTSLFAATAPTPSKAPTTSPSPSIGDSQLQQQINDLKERIASRVAQLKLVDKRGIIGVVTDVSGTQISITDSQGNLRLIDVDELTKFSSPSAQDTFGISDLTKGSTVGAIGLYNKDSRHLLARWVDVLVNPTIFNGVVLAIDKDNFALTVSTNTKQTITADVEDITKTSSYTSDSAIVRSGFSKITVGERITVVGFFDIKDKKTLIASRLLLFPNLPPNPQIPLVNPQDIAPITPSTGSGKKLTPLGH